MEPILVPGPPKEAFNKHRPISDLVRKQVEHFKHIEEKFSPDVRATLPQHDIVTENEAARYISAMTSYLLSRPRPKPAAKKTVAIKPPVPIRPGRPLTLAAAAAPARKKSAAKKKSAPKKETPAAKKSLSPRTKVKPKAKTSKPKAKKSSPKRKK
jgi:hypothetical protein